MSVDQWTPLEEGRFHLRNMGARTPRQWSEALRPGLNRSDRAAHVRRIVRTLEFAQAELIRLKLKAYSA